MKKILVLGAGRSATVLIWYLLEKAGEWETAVTIGDLVPGRAEEKLENHSAGNAIFFDATDETMRARVIAEHDIIVSLLPTHLDILIAREALIARKHLITASYAKAEIQQLNEEVKRAGLLFMFEMGLDPGIDHMSAMKIIHEIQSKEGKITSFRSTTGGLIEPDSDDNPWHYKITWSPGGVVRAGQDAAQYLENNIRKFIPPHRIFSTTEKLKLEGYGKFESYPNSDALSYISKYGLHGVNTMIRSTLRKEGFCSAWNALIQLGLTDDSYVLQNGNSSSYADWTLSCLPEKAKWQGKSVKSRTAKFLGAKQKDALMHRLEWLGLFSDEKIQIGSGTAAQILQDLIERKWIMKPDDKDMVVMRHEIGFIQDGKQFDQVSTMVLKGENPLHTAMAKTVGLTLGIMVKLLLKEDLFLTGVHIPVMAQIYEPTLAELESHGVKFMTEINEIP